MKNRPNSPAKAQPINGRVRIVSMFHIIAIKPKRVNTISIRTTISTRSHDSALKPYSDEIATPMNTAPNNLVIDTSMGHANIARKISVIKKYASPKNIVTKK